MSKLTGIRMTANNITIGSTWLNKNNVITRIEKINGDGTVMRSILMHPRLERYTKPVERTLTHMISSEYVLITNVNLVKILYED